MALSMAMDTEIAFARFFDVIPALRVAPRFAAAN